MAETPPDPPKAGAAKVVSLVSFVVAAIVVMVLLHRCQRDPGPAPGGAAASLSKIGTGGLPAPSGRGGANAAKFDREVDSSAAPGVLVFKAVKTHFPDEYQAYLRLYADRSGAGVPIARFKAETKAWMASFIKRHLPDLLRAPDGLLLATVHAQMGAAIALRATSPTLCAHYATTGFQPGDAEPSPQALVALEGASATRIAAMGLGRNHPARAEPTAMAPADAKAFADAAMRLGVTSADFDQMGSAPTAAAMPLERQCDVSIKMLQAITTLPQAQAGRVAAVIFQNPAKLS